MRNKWIAALLLMVSVAGAYLFLNRDSDEELIEKNLAEIVSLVEKNGDESVFVLIGDSRKIMRYVSVEPQIDLGSPLPIINDREELESIIIQVRQTVQALSVRIAKKELTISEDRTSAQMDLEVVGSGSYFDESGRERRRFSVEWAKEEGDWLIKRVEQRGSLFP